MLRNKHQSTEYLLTTSLSGLVCLFTGYLIRDLWLRCQIPELSKWGAFYALWVPLTFFLFLQLYYLLFALNLRQGFEKALRADVSTIWLILLFFLLLISWEDGGNIFLWLGILYFGFLGIKAFFLLTFLYENLAGKEGGELVRGEKLALVTSAFLLYLLSSAYVKEGYHATSDEPHILLITHSMAYDGDLDLSNNYEARDYTAFYPATLYPQEPQDIRVGKRLYSNHDPLLSFLLIPGYVLAGRWGAVVTMSLLTALLALNLYLLVVEELGTRRAAFLTYLLMSFSQPLFTYSAHLYSDLPAGLLLLWAVRALRKGALGRGLYAVGLSVSLLPWLDGRYCFLCLPLFLFGLRSEGFRTEGKRPLLLPVALSALTLLIFNTLLYKNPMKYEPGPLGATLSLSNLLDGALGLWLDQKFGVLVYSPIYLLALASLGSFFRKKRECFFHLLGCGLPYFLVVSLSSVWFGEWTPPGRLMVPLLPLLAPVMAWALRGSRGLLFWLTLRIMAGWTFLNVFFYAITPAYRYTRFLDGAGVLIRSLDVRLDTDLSQFLPSFLRPNPATFWVSLLVITTLVILNLRGLLRERSLPGAPIPHESLLPLALVGVVVMTLMAALTFNGLWPTTILEAEDLEDMRPTGGSIFPPDETLYKDFWAGQRTCGWKLEGPSSLISQLHLREGPHQFLVYARSQDSQGLQPLMSIRLEEEEVFNVEVDSEEWQTYEFSAYAPWTGPYDLSISLINLRKEQEEEPPRALIIDKVLIKPQKKGTHEHHGKKFKGTMLYGWYPLELIRGEEDIEGDFNWSQGKRSLLIVPLPKKGDYEMQMRLLPMGNKSGERQRMKIWLNGQLIEEVSLEEGWRLYTVSLPSALTRKGKNEVLFEYAFTLSPFENSGGTVADTRDLAVAFDYVYFIQK